VLTQQEHWIPHKTKSIVLRSKICLAVINIGDKKKVHIEESPYLEILGRAQQLNYTNKHHSINC
jgi:hypothetical protein